MNEEIEYIEPTQEHVGQMVEVQSIRGTAWVERKLLAILSPPQLERFVCESILDRKPVTTHCSLWHRARIARPLTYAERQSKCGLKVGDRVRFTREWTDEEGKGTVRFLDFSRSMNAELGKVGVIVRDSKAAFYVRFKGFSWNLPYFVLEKVEDRVATHLDTDGTVYVDGAPQDEFRLLHVYVESDAPSTYKHFAVVRSGDKRFVYELSNLRVKE